MLSNSWKWKKQNIYVSGRSVRETIRILYDISFQAKIGIYRSSFYKKNEKEKKEIKNNVWRCPTGVYKMKLNKNIILESPLLGG